MGVSIYIWSILRVEMVMQLAMVWLLTVLLNITGVQAVTPSLIVQQEDGENGTIKLILEQHVQLLIAMDLLIWRKKKEWTQLWKKYRKWQQIMMDGRLFWLLLLLVCC